jgi:hypothetical protein
VTIVGAALELLAPVMESGCQAIPDPLCAGPCITNPLKIACQLMLVVAQVILGVYGIFEVSTHLFPMLFLSE